jgi:hypothetical protein
MSPMAHLGLDMAVGLERDRHLVGRPGSTKKIGVGKEEIRVGKAASLTSQQRFTHSGCS